jgi:aspartyl-tRNA(Asn)/glutamyl-tRNA(Gln) amidotransferase subunit C
MARITRQQIDHIARLSQLSLSDEEAESMQRDLERILDYVASLEALDTTGVEPTAHAIALDTPLREDRALPPMDPEEALANAPERSGTAFIVPKVIDAEAS